MPFKSFSLLDLIQTEDQYKEFQSHLRKKERHEDHPMLQMTFEEWKSKSCSIGDIIEASITQKH